jgi:hypothetical protein
MAVNPTKIADIQFALKQEFDTTMHDIPNVEPRLLEQVEKYPARFHGVGKYAEMPLHTEGGMRGVGAVEEGNLMAPFTPQVGTVARIYAKTQAFPVECTDMTLSAAKKGAGAYVDYMAWEFKKKKDWAREQESRQCWGDGHGVLGVVASVTANGVTPGVVTFDASTNMQNFRVGMRVDFWNDEYTLANRRHGSDLTTNNQTTRDVGWEITAVNEAARTITVNGEIGDTDGANDPPIAGDWAIIENVGIGINGAAAGDNLDNGKEYTGFTALFSDGNIITTIQNVTLATYPELKAYIDSNGGVGRDITIDMLQSAEDRVERRTGKMVDFVGMNYGQRRKLLSLGLPDVRHTSQEIKLGFKKIDWNGHPLFIDRLAPLKKVLVAALKGNVGRVELEEWHPVDHGEVGLRRTSALDFQWAYAKYANLCLINPAGGVWITDLNEPS